MKLPKQWLHWSKKARIKPEIKRHKYSCHYMIGLNRHWRVNCNNQFECSCELEDFDRWANSRESFVNYVPKTEQEFLDAVVILLAIAREKALDELTQLSQDVGMYND